MNGQIKYYHSVIISKIHIKIDYINKHNYQLIKQDIIAQSYRVLITFNYNIFVITRRIFQYLFNLIR